MSRKGLGEAYKTFSRLFMIYLDLSFSYGKAKFDEYLSLYLKDNCSDGKVNVKNEINISYLVSRLYSMYPKILRRKRPFGILEE
jgi:hypothetical protein